MCGILCRICVKPNDSDCGCALLEKRNLDEENFTVGNDVDDLQEVFTSRRGPDIKSTCCFNIDNDTYKGESSFRVHLSSHVLWTQGSEPQLQPYSNDNGTKLMLFNGDIYSYFGFPVEENHNSPHEYDGLKLFQLLENCNEIDEICHVISQLQGPFAFILLDKSKSELIFARDFFGRQSLLFSHDVASRFPLTWDISSVTVYERVCEVPTFGLFRINLRTKQLTCFPYSHSRTNVSMLCQNFFEILRESEFIKQAIISGTKISTHFSCKVKSPPPLSSSDTEIVLESLLNEARISNSAEDFIRRIQVPLFPAIGKFLHFMRLSIRRRVSTLPPYCKNCICHKLHGTPEINCDHAKVGVLFSGGLDSTVIAYLAAEALPPNSTLDLINVAFSKNDNFTNIPDRETALASFKMLQEKFQFQRKQINLVLVDVQKDEVQALRKERIKHLISPHTSVLDDSVGVCLWFAARGKGYLYSHTQRISYESPMRIVLVGSGADELLGGYGRHRSAFERSGWNGLHTELQGEIDRISIRNLGRDNRILSDHGLCPRMPFLDENLVDFLTARVDLWVKCCPVNEGPLGNRGSGEKLLLRAVAAHLFGNAHVSLALFPKRAMQFGSRIAKLENSKEKGGDACQRLL